MLAFASVLVGLAVGLAIPRQEPPSSTDPPKGLTLTIGLDAPHVTAPATTSGSGEGLEQRADFKFKDTAEALRCFKAAKDAAAVEYRRVLGE